MVTFSDANHIPPFLDEIVTSLMGNSTLTAVCGNNVECLFDFDQTGDIEVGMAAMAVESEAEIEMQEACKCNAWLQKHTCYYMLNKNTLGVKKVRGQSEAALQIGMCDQKL